MLPDQWRIHDEIDIAASPSVLRWVARKRAALLPHGPELLLVLGRLSLRNELWGKAREYFETSLKLRRNRETLAELSRLNAHMGEEEASIKLLMQGLETDHGLPDLPMPRA